MRRFDVYLKADSMVQEKSFTGAVITLLSSLFIIILFRSEFNSYSEVRVRDHMIVDPAYGERLITVNLSLSFLKLKCFFPKILLDASSHLYERPCPSVGQLVRWLVRKQIFLDSE